MCMEVSNGPGQWPQVLQDIIDDFTGAFDDSERYEMLFDLAARMDELPLEMWCAKTKVHGCQSEAHVLACKREDGGFHLRGAADSRIVQGLMMITATALEGLSFPEVASFSPKFAEQMGIAQALSPSRANGFLNMFKKVQAEAALLEG